MSAASRGGKSFAQHLQEIEQEAARAASRCAADRHTSFERIVTAPDADFFLSQPHLLACRVRLAHSKAHSALDDVSTGAPPTTPLSAWPENAPAGAPAASSGAGQMAMMQREHTRMAWDLSVMKRSMPELEAAVAMSDRMAEVRAPLSALSALSPRSPHSPHSPHPSLPSLHFPPPI